MKILAIDVGGTETKSAIVDDAYNVTDWQSVSTVKTGLEPFLNSLVDVYNKYKEHNVDGVAISLPGFIDVEHGRCLSGGSLTFNANQDIGPLLEERMHVPVRLENDGKAAALAELANGSLKGCDNAAVFIIGTGIAGGIIIDGKLLRGKKFTAGELSFVCSNIQTEDKQDDKYGSMANYCSTSSLLRMYKQESGCKEDINGKYFFERYEENDPIAIKVLDKFASNIAVQLMNLGVILNCEKIAVGGGIAQQKVLLDKITEKMDKVGSSRFIHAFGLENYMLPEIVPCTYSRNANLVGAVYSYKER